MVTAGTLDKRRIWNWEHPSGMGSGWRAESLLKKETLNRECISPKALLVFPATKWSSWKGVTCKSLSYSHTRTVKVGYIYISKAHWNDGHWHFTSLETTEYHVFSSLPLQSSNILSFAEHCTEDNVLIELFVRYYRSWLLILELHTYTNWNIHQNCLYFSSVCLE